MTPKKLKTLKKELAELRKSPQGRSSAYFRGFAARVGRAKVNRGKEPTFERNDPPPLPPLTIPGHPGDIAIGTARSVINQLLNDCDEWDLYFQNQERDI